MSGPLRQVIGDALVWDNHACMPMRPDDPSYLPMLDGVREAGVHVMSINVSFGDYGPDHADAMLRQLHGWIADRPETLMLVGTAADADIARDSGRLGICFDMESMTALGGDVGRVEHFYRLGVRWMLGTYNMANAAAGGCMEEDAGLTGYGRAVIAEMNRVGMAVCASHCGYRTAREMIDVSADPVIFSHSNALAVWDSPRNIPDDLIRACAARGGVIGIVGFGPFLGQGGGVDAYVAHVEHMFDLVGDDHVGVSLDYVFDQQELNDFILANPEAFPPSAYPTGAPMLAPADLPAIATALRDRGHGPATLAKFFGGNHRRIAETVWK